MSLQKLMANYADYNVWANQTLVDWITKKPAELLDQEIPSSFPSISKTIVHIWDTERFWITVLQAAPPPASFRMNGYFGTTEEAIQGLLEQSQDFASYVRSLSEDELSEMCHLNTPWAKGDLPKYEFIQHAMNHSTYHRGQIVTIGRNLGLTDAPMTDYNYYNIMLLMAV